MIRDIVTRDYALKKGIICETHCEFKNGKYHVIFADYVRDYITEKDYNSYKAAQIARGKFHKNTQKIEIYSGLNFPYIAYYKSNGKTQLMVFKSLEHCRGYFIKEYFPRKISFTTKYML